MVKRLIFVYDYCLLGIIPGTGSAPVRHHTMPKYADTSWPYAASQSVTKGESWQDVRTC